MSLLLHLLLGANEPGSVSISQVLGSARALSRYRRPLVELIVRSKELRQVSERCGGRSTSTLQT